MDMMRTWKGRTGRKSRNVPLEMSAEGGSRLVTGWVGYL